MREVIFMKLVVRRVLYIIVQSVPALLKFSVDKEGKINGAGQGIPGQIIKSFINNIKELKLYPIK